VEVSKGLGTWFFLLSHF